MEKAGSNLVGFSALKTCGSTVNLWIFDCGRNTHGIVSRLVKRKKEPTVLFPLIWQCLTQIPTVMKKNFTGVLADFGFAQSCVPDGDVPSMRTFCG